MARLNTTGNVNKLQHITQASLGGSSIVTADPEAYEIHIEFMPSGGLTIVLPGPKAVPANQPPGEPPNDGDYYAWKDPLGLVTNANPLTLQGGGFKFATGTPSGQTTLTFNGDFTGLGAEFTFNDQLGMWVGCACGPVVIIET